MSIETIQEFYELGLWNKEQIAQLVSAGTITPVEYKEITVETYSQEESQKPTLSSEMVFPRG